MLFVINLHWLKDGESNWIYVKFAICICSWSWVAMCMASTSALSGAFGKLPRGTRTRLGIFLIRYVDVICYLSMFMFPVFHSMACFMILDHYDSWLRNLLWNNGGQTCPCLSSGKHTADLWTAFCLFAQRSLKQIQYVFTTWFGACWYLIPWYCKLFGIASLSLLGLLSLQSFVPIAGSFLAFPFVAFIFLLFVCPCFDLLLCGVASYFALYSQLLCFWMNLVSHACGWIDGGLLSTTFFPAWPTPHFVAPRGSTSGNTWRGMSETVYISLL